VLASRTHWRLLIATILVLIGAVWLVPRFVEAPNIQENRVLAKAPAWPHHLRDIRRFRKEADAYVADNFPIRPHLIGVLNRLRMLVGVSGSNRVIIGRDGWLFYDDDSHLGAARNAPPMTGPEIRAWLSALAGRTEAVKAAGATYVVLTPPVKETIYPQNAPPWFTGVSLERATVALPKLATAAQAGDVVYLWPSVAAATRAGQKTYSRHDTHWTGYGAYAGYVALMRHLQAIGLAEGPRPLSDFHRIDAPGQSGPRDLALMLGVSSFVTLDFPHFDNPGAAKLNITFLGPKRDWTAPQVVETGEVGKPTLLMTRDSFSNEILPFMLSHFSRIVLAHNQDGFWRPDLIARFKPDIVILEVIEPGLRVAVANGPPPSATALARIDRVLGRVHTPANPAKTDAPGMPTLGPPPPKVAAAFAAAKPTANCNLETAKLTAGLNGEAMVSVSGWISELGQGVTAPDGWVRLQGPKGDVAAPIRVNGMRPDVADYFKNPNGLESGFLGTYFVKQLPAGVYAPTIYRHAPGGLIACAGRQTLIAP
jgi:hypothetical protein